MGRDATLDNVLLMPGLVACHACPLLFSERREPWELQTVIPRVYAFRKTSTGGEATLVLLMPPRITMLSQVGRWAADRVPSKMGSQALPSYGDHFLGFWV